MQRRNRRKKGNKMPKPWLRQVHGFGRNESRQTKDWWVRVKPHDLDLPQGLLISIVLVWPRFSTGSAHQNLLAGLLTCQLLSSTLFLILQVNSGLEQVPFKQHPSWWWHCWSENHTWRTRLLEVLTLPGHQYHLESFDTMPMPCSTPWKVWLYRSDRGCGHAYVLGNQGDAKVQSRYRTTCVWADTDMRVTEWKSLARSSGVFDSAHTFM